MNAVRPGHEHEHEDGYGRHGRGPGAESEPGYDPLTDPLPPDGYGSPWFRASDAVAPDEAHSREWSGHQYPGDGQETYQYDWYAAASVPGPAGSPVPAQPTAPEPEQFRVPAPEPEQFRVPAPEAEQFRVPAPEPEPFRTLGPTRDQFRTPVAEPNEFRAPVPEPERTRVPVSEPILVPEDETVGLRTSEGGLEAVLPPSGPGRAERRRAAKGRGRGRSAVPSPASAPGEPSKPLSRLEARRAARAAKDSPAVIASRAIGELFITFGVLMLLFVTYQLWWTNILAGQQADKAASQIQDDWTKGRKPDAFEPGQGFAIMYIPKLDVVVPIAEGIDKNSVLDRGMVGHYGEGKLKTAMPEDKQGNFAVAGHRNTHGEPFRYINRLEPGDPIVVETQDTYYTYAMASILPQTPPSNVSVISPVPEQSGFKQPGRYITLTTCTPEFTSTYRMIVWGKMVEERPRSKGKPDALVG